MVAFNPQSLCGWVQNPTGIRQASKELGALRQVASQLIGSKNRETLLLLPLLKHKPKWRRGSQGLGDCVSWGAELCGTALMAVESELGTMTWTEEAATESIYGGCRVEALNKKSGGYSDGAFGYAAAKWLAEFGLLLRLDYSKQTGNKEHDLRKYSADKAKSWGNFGCGGKDDKGALDKIARVHPVEHVAQVNDVEEAIAALENWYPVSIASMAGFGDMRRNADGICRRVGTWGHQMMLSGLRYLRGKPIFRCTQSWGDSCSGPDPGIEELIASIPNLRIDRPSNLWLPEGFKMSQQDQDLMLAEWNPISACSWWITEEDLAWILKTGDCWTYSGVKGFEPRNLDTKKAILGRLS